MLPFCNNCRASTVHVVGGASVTLFTVASGEIEADSWRGSVAGSTCRFGACAAIGRDHAEALFVLLAPRLTTGVAVSLFWCRASASRAGDIASEVLTWTAFRYLLPIGDTYSFWDSVDSACCIDSRRKGCDFSEAVFVLLARLTSGVVVLLLSCRDSASHGGGIGIASEVLAYAAFGDFSSFGDSLHGGQVALFCFRSLGNEDVSDTLLAVCEFFGFVTADAVSCWATMPCSLSCNASASLAVDFISGEPRLLPHLIVFGETFASSSSVARFRVLCRCESLESVFALIHLVTGAVSGESRFSRQGRSFGSCFRVFRCVSTVEALFALEPLIINGPLGESHGDTVYTVFVVLLMIIEGFSEELRFSPRGISFGDAFAACVSCFCVLRCGNALEALFAVVPLSAGDFSG